MWSDLAACRGHHHPDAWFPSQGELSRSNREAIQLCRTCEVSAECLAYALTHRTDGIWGGLTAAQREPMLSRQAKVRELVPCGTAGAYRRHKRRGEPVCRACREAEREYRCLRRWAHTPVGPLNGSK